MSEAGVTESHEQPGYLLWVDPRSIIRCAKVRMVREDSVRHLMRILTKDGYTANQPPTVYEPDPNVRACDMSEAERANKLFRIRDGAHRLCALSKMMADRKDPKFTEDFRVHVRVVPFNTDDLARRADAVGDNFATENPITIRTTCDELWALMRSALLERLVAYSTEWEAVATSGGYRTAGMPRANFPQMTENVFDEFTRLIRNISPWKPVVLTPDEAAIKVGYVKGCRYIQESIPPGRPPNAELKFIERHKREADHEGTATGASGKRMKWNTLCRLLPHAAIVDTPDEALREDGSGLVRVERQDTRLWDIMCAVNNKGTALSTVPGSIDFMAMRTAFFTKEAGRRPFPVIFFFAAGVRVAKTRSQTNGRGQPKGRCRAVTDLAYQVKTVCWQYQCYGALAMCMIGCAGPPTPSRSRVYHTLVVAPGFLAIFTIGPSATVYTINSACHTKYLPRVQCHMKELSRFHPLYPMDRAGALPVGSYALPNSLPVCCLYHRLHNSVCGDGNTGPLSHRDGAARAP
jgi:hypothetical protein